MNNLEKYISVFEEVFGIKGKEVDNLRYQQIKAWDSVGHMNLIAALEDTFDILFDTDDIIAFNSFEVGKGILQEKYDIVF